MKPYLMYNDIILIIIDESADARIAGALKNRGIKIFSIQEEMPGIDDLSIIELAYQNEGYIITEDEDFRDE